MISLPCLTVAACLNTFAADGFLLGRYSAAPIPDTDVQVAVTCQIFPNMILIGREIGGVGTTEERPIYVQPGLQKFMDQAAQGNVTLQGAPGKPALVYIAASNDPNRVERYIDLGSVIENTETVNDAPIAAGLRAFLDAHCPRL